MCRFSFMLNSDEAHDRRLLALGRAAGTLGWQCWVVWSRHGLRDALGWLLGLPSALGLGAGAEGEAGAAVAAPFQDVGLSSPVCCICRGFCLLHVPWLGRQLQP